MLSAVIHTRLSYPAVPLAGQPVHQRSVHSGPLVLGANLLKNQRLQQIGDQPVSRMFPRITACIGLYLHPDVPDGWRVVSTGRTIARSLGIVPL
jgi:hypothetical protein